VENCTVSGNIISNPDINWDPENPNNNGGIIGYNYGTVSGCNFSGSIIGSTAGGIVGTNSGTVSNCHKLIGSVSDGDVQISTGGIIGKVYNESNYYGDVNVTGNTFSKAATGQTWGIGKDYRLSPAGPSNNGAAPIDPF
jgi:hypothetical protein